MMLRQFKSVIKWCHGAPILLTLAFVLPLVSQAQIAQTVNSGGTSTSWDNSIWGSPAAAPSSGQAYQTTSGLMSSDNTYIGVYVTGRLRAYGAANSANPTFLGDSLAINSGTELLLKDPDTYTVHLILNGGMLRWAPNSAGSVTLDGTLDVATDSYIGVVQSGGSTLNLNATLTGTNVLYLRAAQNDGNSLVFGGNLSGFTGAFDIGGGANLLTVDFSQDYSLPSANLLMGNDSTDDRLNLSHHLTFHTFSFGGTGLAPGTYSAAQLNALFGSGSQFLDNGGSLTVLNGPTTNTAPVVKAMVFIIGDSTVLNHAPIVGWGQVINRFFDTNVLFQDDAYPGESSKTFITDGRWSNVLSQLSTNDYLLIQFGHNDSHNPPHVEATNPSPDPDSAGTNVDYYRNNLKRYIDETRAKGAIPVLVTPMHRRSFDTNGNLLSYIVDSTGYTNDLAPYAAAMKQVAASNNVPCVNLFASSGVYMQQLGNDLLYSTLMYQGDGGTTHFNVTGATLMASLVTRGLSEVLPAPAAPSNPKELTQYLELNMPSTNRFETNCPAVSGFPQASDDFPVVQAGTAATIVYDSADAKVVEITSGLFASDIQRVTGILPVVTNTLTGVSGRIVLLCIIGHSSMLDNLIANGKINVSAIQGGWERYQIQVVENPFPGISRALVIAGSDRRGTAYGAFSLSEAMGVSPWYWWADVTPLPMPEVYVSAAPFISQTPSVRYRGIFINDEDWGLSPWAKKNFASVGNGGVGDIGPKTYAKVFELLLRLKANYIWPAMHPVTAAFNHYTNDPIVADDYAIVLGSSHAEPMLRDNDYEWNKDIDPQAGNTWASGGSFDFSSNSNAVYRYWEQRAIDNGQYENVWPLGKRGIGDSPMPEGTDLASKAGWLNTIIAAQRQMLSNHVNTVVSEVPQMFTPYKEVLDIYNTGLVNLPDDVTLGWPDDNFGYIRRLSNPTEELRSGGGGVYYHASYWGSPADYLWLCSTPPSQIWEEMTKAYAYNCHRIWVLNVGDIKPAESDIGFFMQLAWNVNHFDANAQSEWLHEWAARDFGSVHADAIASIMNKYYQLGYARKPEHMNWKDADPNSPGGPYPLFSCVHYGDEAAQRLAAYSNLVVQAQSVYAGLPSDRRSAFYEMVLYPVLGADGMNRKFLDCEKAYVASIQGRNTATNYSAASQQGYNDIQADTTNYNQLENGKWNYIMSDDPRGQAVFNQPPLPSAPALGSGSLGVAVEGQLDSAIVGSGGVTNDSVNLNAATDGVLTSPTIATNIAGMPATWTPGTGGLYSAGNGGKAVYNFNVPSNDNYTLAFEINCPTANDDSWYIQMDNGSAATWNNLSNGGVWTWTTFGTFNLTAGQHTLTVYEREDGAAMAGIKLTAGSSALVEDNSEPSFELPEFNRYTQRSHFVDLFNTGTGSVNWQVMPADPWVHITQTSGSLASEKRLWVSIDWTNAPESDALTSSLTVSNSDTGQSLVIPVHVWNPAMQLPAGTDFVEDNHAVAIEAEHYSKLIPGSDGATWSFLPNLGSGEGLMMVSPVTAASRTNVFQITNTSPVLEYNVYLRSAGTVSMTARMIPTLPINDTRSLRYAVSFDDETPQIVDMSRTSGSGNVWSRSVLRNYIDYTTTHTLESAGAHTLKIWMVDPGVVLDRIVIATAALPYTYGGPQETSVAGFGSETITNGQSLILSSNQTLTCDSLTNNGTLTLLGSAQLNVGGPFVNNGLLDIMTWQGTLPAGFINNGTVLDRSAVQINGVSSVGDDLHISIQGYEGHSYQLQHASDVGMSEMWTNIGDPVPGENAPLSFLLTNALISGQQGFYRLLLKP